MFLHPHPHPHLVPPIPETQAPSRTGQGCVWPPFGLGQLSWDQPCPGVPEGLRTLEGPRQTRMQEAGGGGRCQGQNQPWEGQKKGVPVVVIPRPPLSPSVAALWFRWPQEAGLSSLARWTHTQAGHARQSQLTCSVRRAALRPLTALDTPSPRLREATEPPSRVSVVASPLTAPDPCSSHLPLRPSGALSFPRADDPDVGRMRVGMVGGARVKYAAG